MLRSCRLQDSGGHSFFGALGTPGPRPRPACGCTWVQAASWVYTFTGDPGTPGSRKPPGLWSLACPGPGCIGGRHRNGHGLRLGLRGLNVGVNRARSAGNRTAEHLRFAGPSYSPPASRRSRISGLHTRRSCRCPGISHSSSDSCCVSGDIVQLRPFYPWTVTPNQAPGPSQIDRTRRAVPGAPNICLETPPRPILSQLYPPLGADIFDSWPKPAQNRPKPAQTRPKPSQNRSKPVKTGPKQVQNLPKTKIFDSGQIYPL